MGINGFFRYTAVKEWQEILWANVNGHPAGTREKRYRNATGGDEPAHS